MTLLDANESALRNYMRKLDSEEWRIKLIEDRVIDLMATSEYAHDNGTAIQEAISEASLKDCEMLGLAARKGALFLGSAMLNISFQYWHKMAEDKATDEVNAEWDSCRCHGAGCKFCQERDE